MEKTINTNEQLVWKALPVKNGVVGYPKISANLTKDITEEIKGVSIIPFNFKKKRECSFRKDKSRTERQIFNYKIRDKIPNSRTKQLQMYNEMEEL